MVIGYGLVRYVRLSLVLLGTVGARTVVAAQESDTPRPPAAFVTYASVAVLGPLPFSSHGDDGGPGVDLVVGYRGTRVFWGAGGTAVWLKGDLWNWSVFGEVRRRSDRGGTLVGKYRWLSGIRVGYSHVAPGGTWSGGGGPSASVMLGQEYLVGKPVGVQLMVGLGGQWIGGEVRGVATGLLGITTRFP
jgi:hypothetical protein